MNVIVSKILVINLQRSKKRKAFVKNVFKNDNLFFIEGVDGRVWEDSGRTDLLYPVLSYEAFQYLVHKDVLISNYDMAMQLMPCEIGCALGHYEAWKYIIDNKLEFAIVLEDDIMPTNRIGYSLKHTIEHMDMPQDMDVMFLHGEDTPVSGIRLDDKNRVIKGFCNYGYIITYTGAKRAIEAQFPMIAPVDRQWWQRAFTGFDAGLKNMDKLSKTGYAYAQKKGLVQPHLGLRTTMYRKAEQWRQ